MSIDLHYEYGENVCITPVGDIPNKHIGQVGHDITYHFLDDVPPRVKRRLRVLQGGLSSRGRSHHTASNQ